MNILIIIISILTIFLSVKMFSKASGSMSLLKMHTVSYVFYVQLVTSGIVGSVLLVMGVIDYHPDVKLMSDAVKFEAWAWVMYSIIAMPIGMISLNMILNLDVKTLFNSYLSKPIEFIGSTLRNNIVLIFTALFSIIVLTYIFFTTEKIALFTLLIEGDSSQAAVDRITSRNNYKGIIYIKNLLGYIMIPVMAYYAYIFLRTKVTIISLVVFVINFSITALLMTHDTQKAPIAFFIFGFIILEVFLSNGIGLKKMVLFGGGPVLLILIGYTLTTGVDGLDQFTRFNSGFYGRVFVGSYLGFPLSLEFFPNIITEQTFAVGIPERILQSIGANYVESARLLKIYTHPETIANGTGNLYSSYYMGEAWANFGYLGLIIAPFIVGAVVHIVHLFLLLKPKNPYLMAFYVALTVKWVVNSGFVNFLYLKLLLWPLLLYFVSNYLVVKFLNQKK